jgi:hypothetical protein
MQPHYALFRVGSLAWFWYQAVLTAAGMQATTTNILRLHCCKRREELRFAKHSTSVRCVWFSPGYAAVTTLLAAAETQRCAPLQAAAARTQQQQHCQLLVSLVCETHTTHYSAQGSTGAPQALATLAAAANTATIMPALQARCPVAQLYNSYKENAWNMFTATVAQRTLPRNLCQCWRWWSDTGVAHTC